MGEAIRLKNPSHPGGFIRREIVQALDLSVTEAAHALGVTRPALSALLNERAGLSSEMALRIEKAFGVSMETLMRMQNSYDIARARRLEGEIHILRYVRRETSPGRPPTSRQSDAAAAPRRGPEPEPSRIAHRRARVT